MSDFVIVPRYPAGYVTWTRALATPDAGSGAPPNVMIRVSVVLIDDLTDPLGDTSAPQCDCWRLTRPLSPAERLPDNPVHVCDQTMRQSVLAWQADHIDANRSDAPTWPVMHNGRQLALVIRQWVLEEATPALVRRWAADDRWQWAITQLKLAHALDLMLGRCIALRKAGAHDTAMQMVGPIVAKFERRAALHGTEASGFDVLVNTSKLARDDERAAWLLRVNGLPDNPAVVAHLRARSRAEPNPPRPARGLLVTTLAYGADEVLGPGTVTRFLVGPYQTHLHTYESDRTDTLVQRADAIVRAHRRWLRQFDISRLLTRSTGGHGGGRFVSADNPETDYFVEALRPAGLMQLARNIRAGEMRGYAVSGYLKQVDARVRKRRCRGGLPATPPRGWSAAARSEINRRLDTLLARDHDVG